MFIEMITNDSLGQIKMVIFRRLAVVMVLGGASEDGKVVTRHKQLALDAYAKPSFRQEVGTDHLLL